MGQHALAPKDRLFDTAARLFYQQGYRAVGVDTLAAESGIGKMTLYRHYPSKDDLIVAYLHHSDSLFWENFEAITRDAADARSKIVAFFASLGEYVQSPTCYGCPFLNAATEYPEPEHPAHQVALAHKQSVRERFAYLVSEAGAPKPAALADQLVMLMDGAYMAARMFGSSNPGESLDRAAQALLDAAFR